MNKGLDQNVQKANLKIYGFTRVAFGVISSPLLLSATLVHHLRTKCTKFKKEGMEEYATIIRETIDNIYLDNLITGASNCKDAINVYQPMKTNFKEAPTNLQEWSSNDPEFEEAIEEEDREKDNTVKLLGILWNKKTGSLEIDLRVSEDDLVSITKRQILRRLAQNSDPLGLFTPVIINGKLFSQKLWKQHYDWGQELPEEMVQRWKSICQEWDKIAPSPLPRLLINKESKGNWQLHTFVDASSTTYAAVTYLRFEGENAKANSYLLYSKNRLCPCKGMTIPCLELMAILIGTKITKFITSQVRLRFNNCIS